MEKGQNRQSLLARLGNSAKTHRGSTTPSWETICGLRDLVNCDKSIWEGRPGSLGDHREETGDSMDLAGRGTGSTGEKGAKKRHSRFCRERRGRTTVTGRRSIATSHHEGDIDMAMCPFPLNPIYRLAMPL